MIEVQRFFEELNLRRQTGEVDGTSLLATELSPEDISISMYLNGLRGSDPETLAEEVTRGRYNTLVTEWIARHGYVRATRIALLVHRMKT